MPLSATDKQLLDRIDSDFTYHPPKGDQTDRYRHLRETAKSLATQIVHLCPDGRERSTALSKLEEAVMWANAGIARQDESA